jgi:TolB-like protein/Tfp pilus assembly protein PilF
MAASRDALKDLFFAALERPAAERDDFLAAANADPEVLSEVRALLASHQQADSFLESGLASGMLPALTLSAGQRLGPYEVVELIGEGGMGEVYRALDTRLGRQVAIKVLSHAFGRDKARQQRFEEEARAASALNHPNVLTVYDVGTLSADDGSAFLVMELLEGQTLRQRIGEAPPFSRELILDYGVQVARGLVAAHAAGIVHRDLKPENLFLTTDGRVKILDFGIAKVNRSDDFSGLVTQPGAVIGTAGYMSPEQVRGQPADARSDIFAYGTVLFEMLTGKRAFGGDSSIDTLSAILTADPLQQSESVVGKDPAICKVVGRCIAKDPAARYQSATDIVAALETAAQQRHRWKPSRAAVAMIVAGTLAVAAGLGIAWRRQPAPAEHAADDSKSRVLAVMPFENIAADKSLQYFATGMTEEITAQLARVSSLRMMSRVAVARYSDAPDAPRRMRDELGVGALVTGSVRFAGERARISVQLVDTTTAQAIWSQQYDQAMSDILQLQSDVARHIANALQARMSAEDSERLIKRSTSSPAAYELYLKAVNMPASAQGIALLKDAVKLDPKFAVAYARLSRMQGELGDFGDRQLYADSLASARQAIEADPKEARGHHALATIQSRMGHLTEGRLGFLRALELAPSLPEAAWDLSIASAALGRLDESLFWARRGFVVAPNVSTAYYHVAVPLSALADSDATQRWLRSGEERFPRAGRIQYMLAIEEALSGKEAAAEARVRRALAASPTNPEVQAAVAGHALLSRAADAFARIEELFKQSPESGTFLLPESFRTLHAYHLLERGDTQRAKVLLDESLAAARKALDDGSEGSEQSLEIAAIHALRGERPEALRWVAAAYRAGDRHFRELRIDPLFATLRTDPEFMRIVQQMEADVAAQRQRVDVNDNPPLPPLLSTAPSPPRK